MSKILKNQTVAPIPITDMGVTIPASGQYVIPPPNWLRWAASNDIITPVGTGDVVVSDSLNDLNPSEGIDLIKFIHPTEIEVKDLDGTSEHFFGPVGLLAVAYPPVADKVISEFLINTKKIDSKTKELLVSLDGGIEFFGVERNVILGWSVKGHLTQIHLKGSHATGVDFDMILNFEKV